MSTSPKKTQVSTQRLDAPDDTVHKESIVKGLLSESMKPVAQSNAPIQASQGKRPLIAEIDDSGKEVPVTTSTATVNDPATSLLTPLIQAPKQSTSVASPPTPPVTVDEGPSMLELMMEAQRAADLEKKSQQEQEQKQAAKSGFGGFKKGFFGGGDKAQAKKATTTTAPKTTTSTSAKEEIIEVRKPPPSTAAMKNKPKENRDQIVEEVQRAMEEDQNPLLKQLRSNEWVTGDLMSMISSNQILSQGLKNPRCVTAMELLQRDPKLAQERYKGDPEVGLFLQEFCKVMSVHFTSLGEKQGSTTPASSASTSSSSNIIEEVGPLQARALAKQKESKPSSSTEIVQSAQKTGSSSSAASAETEEERVQRVSRALNIHHTTE